MATVIDYAGGVPAASAVKGGGENDLISRIAADKTFGLTEDEIKGQLAPEKFIGRSVAQTEEFLDESVTPIIEKYFKEDIKLNIT